MTPETLISLFGIAFATSLTPGPNNAMLASSGATYGLRATLPHIAGIILGFPVMIFLVGLGLGEVFRQSQALQQALSWTGALMLLWLAWKTATATPPGKGEKQGGRPLTFWQSAGFQWVNPKGWIAATALSSQFIRPEMLLATSAVAGLAFVVSGAVSTFTWAGFGQVLGRWLGTGARLRLFNLSMAALLVGFLALMLIGRSGSG